MKQQEVDPFLNKTSVAHLYATAVPCAPIHLE